MEKKIGRPKLPDKKKRETLSVSLSRPIFELAKNTPNASHFLDTSVQTSRAVSMVVDAVRGRKMSMEEAMAEIEDIAAVWNAEFEESVEFDAPAKKKA